MIPVAYIPSKKREVQVTLCVHCGLRLSARCNATKKACLECEAKVRHAIDAAGRRVWRAIAAGELRPASEFACADCSKPATCYDHRDYSRPLDVVPVCRSCNNKRGPGRLPT